MTKLNSKTLNELRDNPLARVLMGMFNITDEELNNLEASIKKEEAREEVKSPEVPKAESACGVDYSKNEPEEDSDTEVVELEVEPDETVAIINKEETEALLKAWENVEKDVFELDKQFGINIWDSNDESIYNKYNKIIRMFLETQFGVENADILEDWVFGYDKENRPKFDDVWNNIIKD